MGIRFHWRLLQRGDDDPLGSASAQRVAESAALPDLNSQAVFCKQAEQCGIDSLLVDINYGKPDPMTLALALARKTSRIRLMVAFRPGLMSPTLFVQQINTFSQYSRGRITLNIVAGHSPAEQRYYGDLLAHDDRYRRMDEFLEVAGTFWTRADGGVDFSGNHYRIVDGRLNTPFRGENGRISPEVYIGGSSQIAKETAMKHASCWIRFADAPSEIARDVAPVVKGGTEAALRMSIIARETRKEAIAAASEVVRGGVIVSRSKQEKKFVQATDAQSLKQAYAVAENEWITPTLWTGAVRVYGAPAMALVGSYEEVARALVEYGAVGVSQFILAGWPKREEMLRFGRHVLPMVREMEKNEASAALAG